MGRVCDGNRLVGRLQCQAAAICLVAVCVGITSALGGCTKPLFPDNTYRTQYDQYDRLRGSFVEPHQTDLYGKPVPALRQRLRQN